MHNSLKDNGVFVSQWFKKPLTIGSHFPSSRYLSQAMAASLDVGDSAGVVEFGPGTGAVTKAILTKGIPSQQLCVVELTDHFAQVFRKNYPTIQLIQDCVFEWQQWQHLLPFQSIQAVVSSLPLKLFPIQQNRELIEGILDPQGLGAKRMIQFSYFTREPLGLGEGIHGQLAIKKCHFVWCNIYPATVWQYSLALR